MDLQYRDSCFQALDAVLSVEDIEIVKTPPQKPMCNAFAERFVREARETLDNMILFGESHLSHECKKIEKYHNRYRPHQGLGNIIPLGFAYPRRSASWKSIQCKETLGGLLNHYYVEKKAA